MAISSSIVYFIVLYFLANGKVQHITWPQRQWTTTLTARQSSK